MIGSQEKTCGKGILDLGAPWGRFRQLDLEGKAGKGRKYEREIPERAAPESGLPLKQVLGGGEVPTAGI